MKTCRILSSGFALFFFGSLSPLYAVGPGPTVSLLRVDSCNKSCTERFQIRCGPIAEMGSEGTGISVRATQCDDQFRVYCKPDPLETQCIDGWLVINVGVICPGATNLYTYGRDGNDKIDASSSRGADCALLSEEHHEGNDGNDKIKGSEGRDIMYGGGGDDTLLGGAGDDSIYGEGGNDQIVAGFGRDFVDGGSGADEIFADFTPKVSGPEIPSRYSKADPNIGESGFEDIVYGGSGSDCLNSFGGWDRLWGLAGNDRLFGVGELSGGPGDDVLEAYSLLGSSPVELDGGPGNDRLRGYSLTREIASGGEGNDFLFRFDSEDDFSGGTGYDTYLFWRDKEGDINDPDNSYIVYTVGGYYPYPDCPEDEDFCRDDFFTAGICVIPTFP